MGGEGGRREEFQSVLMFSMPRIKKKNSQNHFVLRNQNLEKEILTKLLGSREINKKNCKNCTKLQKMSKLFQIRSPFISYCKEEPAQETRTSC